MSSRCPVDCPKCQARFYVEVDVEVTSASAFESAVDSWRDTLTAEEKEWIDRAISSGVLTSFTEAIRARITQPVPNNIERSLMSFVRKCVPKRSPRHAHARLVKEWGQDCQLWVADGLAAIVSGGMFRAFAPSNWIEGQAIRNMSNGAVKGRILDDTQIDHWIKTRFGYVPHGAATAALLKQRSIGSFGRLVQ